MNERFLGTKIAILALLSTGSLISCGSDSVSNLSDQERRALELSVQPVSEQVGFRMLVPNYLPTPLSRVGAADSNVNETSAVATLAFVSPQAGAGSPTEATVEHLIIIEESDPQGVLCPPCDDRQRPDYEEVELRSHTVSMKEVATGPNEVTHDMRFRVGDVHMIVQLTWSLPGSSPLGLTESMKREGLRIFESILDQA